MDKRPFEEINKKVQGIANLIRTDPEIEKAIEEERRRQSNEEKRPQNTRPTISNTTNDTWVVTKIATVEGEEPIRGIAADNDGNIYFTKEKEGLYRLNKGE